MRVLLSVALVLTSVSVPAFASETAAEKKICKRTGEGSTGSHIARPRKLCRTAAQWKELEDETERSLRSIKDGGGLDPNAPRPTVSGSPG